MEVGTEYSLGKGKGRYSGGTGHPRYLRKTTLRRKGGGV